MPSSALLEEMSQKLQPVVQVGMPCKCCGVHSPVFGNVDFNRNCEQAYGRYSLPPAEVSIWYYRCPACQFIFTNAFDSFSQEDFRRFIYNDEYVKVDPDYLDRRPKTNASNIERLLEGNTSLSILDYGSGSGEMVRILRERGYQDVHGYDPFVERSQTKPDRKFDLIACFEVVEHSTHPRTVVGEMASMLKKPGVIVFSTLFQPPEVDQIGLFWWYVAPRNGHVSLFARHSMEMLGGPFGLRVASFDETYHLLLEEIPDFGAKRFQQKP